MEFTIKEPLKRDGEPDTFVVEMYWRHGDADKSTLTMSRPFKRNSDEWALEEMLTSLKMLNYIHSIEVEDHADFIKWFDVDCEYGVVEDKYEPFVGLDAECNISYGGGIAGFNGFSVYYYDNQLNKCEVDYKTKEGNNEI